MIFIAAVEFMKKIRLKRLSMVRTFLTNLGTNIKGSLTLQK